MTEKTLWFSILKRLKPTIKKAHFLTWFQGTTVLSNKEGKLLIALPTVYARDWIANKYGVMVLQAAQEVDAEIMELDYEVVGRLGEKGNNEGVDVKELFIGGEKKVRKIRNANEVRVTKDGGEPVETKIFNARYNLKNFVVGNRNRLPHAASNAVVKMPGGIYNPLYVYGAVGLGKTHLLQAIGNGVLREFPDMVVKYMTAEKFVSEVVNAIGKRRMPKFKDQYRNVDCFLIDDVQFFGRKNSSQQEFFHTFNELYDRNKQIVLTSDRPPSELDDLDERLKSRFSMGMVVELLMPDFETRLAILNQKCMEFQAIIDPEVLSFIATNVQTSVRELEGVLRQVMALSQLAETVPTIRSVVEVLQRMNKAKEIIGFDVEAKRNDHIVKNAKDLMTLVADYYHVSVDQMTGKDRHKEVMLPRQICMYLIKNELGESYEKIGMGFGGRNHTTVMHACNKTAQKLKIDIRLVRDVNAIKREMGL